MRDVKQFGEGARPPRCDDVPPPKGICSIRDHDTSSASVTIRQLPDGDAIPPGAPSNYFHLLKKYVERPNQVLELLCGQNSVPNFEGIVRNLYFRLANVLIHVYNQAPCPG
jgi:hypothetical protein